MIYLAGILVGFYLLVSIISVLQQLGYVVGWGFQLQSPLFITVLIGIVIVGLNLIDKFPVLNWMYQLPLLLISKVKVLRSKINK